MMITFLKRITRPIRLKTDPEAFGVTKFIEFASGEVKSSDKVLDAGAGDCRYKKYFTHAKYESTDFEDVFDKATKNTHDFVCDLHSIPRPDNFYEAIICTQVLEHIQYPQTVVNEFYRILKPGGKLFLTVPQGWGLHAEPYHFFNFTKYGLERIFKDAGFQIVFIKPRGGIYWLLAKIIKETPCYILSQHFNIKKSYFLSQIFQIKRLSSNKFKTLFLLVIFLPIALVSEFLIPLFLFYVDKIDKRKAWTLGYGCYCIKKP